MKLSHRLYLFALLLTMAITGAAVATAGSESDAATTPAEQQEAVTLPQGEAPAGAQPVPDLGIPDPVPVQLTECEQECFQRELLCLRVCYRNCNSSIPCMEACDVDCAWVSNQCLCIDCGSPLCIP